MNDSYDCLVLGAGPAGVRRRRWSLGRASRRSLVERETVPARARRRVAHARELLGLREARRAAAARRRAATRRRSACSSSTHTGRESKPFFFRSHFDHPSSETWHVERAEFDQMLFDNAAAKGADCVDQTRVLDVLFEGEGPTAQRRGALRTADGEERTVASRVVVDATGQVLAHRQQARPQADEPRPAEGGHLAALPRRRARRVGRRRQDHHLAHVATSRRGSGTSRSRTTS